VVAYAALAGLQRALPAEHRGVIRLGAVLLVGAGVYQFSSAKRACLERCRSPLAMVAEHLTELERGYAGPFRVGAGHGLFCIGCCWSLMLVLVLLGMMSVTWMGLLAAVMLAEKTAPRGLALTRIVGGACVAVGAVL
jgi:predicted metal-binding membrane protein